MTDLFIVNFSISGGSVSSLFKYYIIDFVLNLEEEKTVQKSNW
jgi:hypothetical protein